MLPNKYSSPRRAPRIRMLAIVLSTAVAAVLGGSVAASPALASNSARGPASASPRLHGQVPAIGFFRGKSVRYLDEGPVQLATDSSGKYLSDVDPLWAVTNGVPGQQNIIDNVPGLNSPDDYTPLWQVVKVTWTNGYPSLLRSAADVQRAVSRGRATVETTDTIVNCPVLGFGQAISRGFHRGEYVGYLDEGPIQPAKDSAGNYLSDVDPLWAVTNGAARQRNIIDNVPGLNSPDDYTPLWQVVEVTWVPGARPFVLKSAAAVDSAVRDGLVVVRTTDTVVNCPVL
jgi:hypothetical protein